MQHFCTTTQQQLIYTMQWMNLKNNHGKTLGTKNTNCMFSFIRCSKQVKIIWNRNQNSGCLWWDEGIGKILWVVYTHTHTYIAYLVLYMLYSLEYLLQKSTHLSKCKNYILIYVYFIVGKLYFNWKKCF